MGFGHPSSDPQRGHRHVAVRSQVVEPNGGVSDQDVPRGTEDYEFPSAGPSPFAYTGPSKEAAGAFYASPEYQPWLEKRKAGAATELILVDGL